MRLHSFKEDFWFYWVFNIEFILDFILENITGESAENVNSTAKSPWLPIQDSQKHSPFPLWKFIESHDSQNGGALPF